MSTNAMRKLSATFLVLVMALSALGYLPIVKVGQGAGTKNIYVPVFSNGSPVTDATVTLTDVHTGDVISADYSSARSSYVVTNAPSGYFRIDVTASDYYDALSADQLSYDGFTNYTVNPIELTAFPYKNYYWNVTVRDAATTHIISGASVGFFDPVAREYVATGTTDVLGRAVVSVFGTAMKGDLELVIKKSLYNTYIEPVNVTANNVTTISLSSSMRVTGFVADWNGPATGVVSYLVNTDPGTPWAKRVLKSTGSGMAFDAYAGNFVLVVDASGDASNVRTLAVGASINLGTIHLDNQTMRVEQVNMTFGADFSSFDLDVGTTWSYDDTHPALAYTDMGSLRIQIDLTLGNCDGYLSAGEAAAFHDMLEAYGPQYVTSQNLLVMNDTVYAAGAMTNYIMNLGEGAVTDMAGVDYSYSCHYTVHGALTAGLSEYGAVVTARYDQTSVDYNYLIKLVSGYELVSNTSTTHVMVSGYLQVDVNPLVYTGLTEKVSLTLQTNRIPVPKATLVSSPFVAPIPNETGVITHYIVRVGRNATFNASESSDPNGNPLTYTWDFGDSSPVVTLANETVVHNYSAAAASVTVTLTVRDVANLTNSTTVKVVCDDRAPKPVLSVKTIHFDGSKIEINQQQPVVFNGTYSYDDAAATDDKLGMISFYEFDYGEGNTSRPIPWADKMKNRTYNWERAGTYKMYMNITDVVGHNASTSIMVVVNDTTKPTVDFTSKNRDKKWSTTLVEGMNTTFDAGNGTSDNVNNKNTLHFKWYFSSDNTTLEGIGMYNVTHIFNKIGSMTVTLNVTDEANNSNVKVKTITITQKPRPDVRVTSISYDPETFTQGKTGTITVNMTNTGSANATGIVLNFWYVVNGQKTLIGTTSAIEKNGTAVTIVGVNEKVQATIEWSPKDKGTYTIEVTVNSTMQLEEHKFTDADALTVKQAAYIQYALWGGVAAIIILVPTLLLLRGRLAKREKKGPRREKKETEEK